MNLVCIRRRQRCIITGMNGLRPRPTITPKEVLRGWGKILSGSAPLLSIEITKECPLSCPGCYAYGDSHLGGEKTLTQLSDFRGEALVQGVLELVRQHRPLQVSLVGGEPMMRHRELSSILPALSAMGVFTMVVTSGVIPIPAEWMELPRVRVAISVDGLPEHHDIRRQPATYERLLKNISGRTVNVHWVITAAMLGRDAYLDEYLAFWSARSEVDRIWVSLYTPQIGEHSAEMLTPSQRSFVAHELARLHHKYPKLLMTDGMAQALITPPKNPQDCLFAKMSVNYSADLDTRVEPCVFGGSPDCSQCGCAASVGLHWIRDVKVVGPLKVGHFVGTSVEIGLLVNRLRARSARPSRWRPSDNPPVDSPSDLVQIGS
jgi:MoaA/NifB/PqqE/SkfB family radical SAM enzyme